MNQCSLLVSHFLYMYLNEASLFSAIQPPEPVVKSTPTTQTGGNTQVVIVVVVCVCFGMIVVLVLVLLRKREHHRCSCRHSQVDLHGREQSKFALFYFVLSIWWAMTVCVYHLQITTSFDKWMLLVFPSSYKVFTP